MGTNHRGNCCVRSCADVSSMPLIIWVYRIACKQGCGIITRYRITIHAQNRKYSLEGIPRSLVNNEIRGIASELHQGENHETNWNPDRRRRCSGLEGGGPRGG